MECPTTLGICRVIEEVLSPVSSRSVLAYALERKAMGDITLSWGQVNEPFLKRVDSGLRLFGVADVRRRPILEKLRLSAVSAMASARPAAMGQVEVTIQSEADIVVARNGVRELARTIGFSHTDPIRIATIVSELARNIQLYCGVGRIGGRPLAEPRSGVEIVAVDNGKGIGNLDQILSGQYRSKSGMGLGLLGCKRLADRFDVTTGPKGTTVQVAKYL